MVHDDDRSGQPFESFSADESPDWPESRPRSRKALDITDQALIVVARDYRSGKAVSSLADVLTRAGASSDPATAIQIATSLGRKGLITTEKASDDIWLRITEAGRTRANRLMR